MGANPPLSDAAVASFLYALDDSRPPLMLVWDPVTEGTPDRLWLSVTDLAKLMGRNNLRGHKFAWRGQCKSPDGRLRAYAPVADCAAFVARHVDSLAAGEAAERLVALQSWLPELTTWVQANWAQAEIQMRDVDGWEKLRRPASRGRKRPAPPPVAVKEEPAVPGSPEVAPPAAVPEDAGPPPAKRPVIGAADLQEWLLSGARVAPARG